MSNKTKPLVKMSHDELLDYTRGLRERYNSCVTKLRTITEEHEVLTLENANLRTELSHSKEAADRLTGEVESLTDQLEVSNENNTKLRALIETDEGNTLANVGRLVLHRLDISNQTLARIAKLLGDEPVDADDEQPNADDEDEEEDEIETDDEVVDDEGPTEDDEIVIERVEEAEVVTNNDDADDQTPAPISGADLKVDDGASAQPGISAADIKALTDSVVPQIQAAVELYDNYEATIVEPVRKNQVTKEYALRIVAAVAFPTTNVAAEEAIANNALIETIVSTDDVREAVYAVMKL